MRLPDPVDGWAERVTFSRAQRRWFRQLDQAASQFEPSGGLAPHLASLERDRPVHVVVVPQEGEDFGTFQAGTRNLYWEAAQTLRELTSAGVVSAFTVARDVAPESWHRDLLGYLQDVRATHLITHIESDPGADGHAWTWDKPARVLAESWDGVVLGVLFDSAWPWIAAKARYLARMSPRFLAVDICGPLDGRLVRGRPEVGPVNMPISDASMSLVDDRLAHVTHEWDVSFIGAMYPYRVELVERLRAAGVSVVVNPHRADRAEDFASSRANQPTWLDYMAGLRSSRMTINFSRSSAGPIEQLKTRVLEATLAGTVLLTDDLDRTRLFFDEGLEYVHFRDEQHLPMVVTGLLADPGRLMAIATAGNGRARALARTSFWEGIDAGLRRRRLPAILPDGTGTHG